MGRDQHLVPAALKFVRHQPRLDRKAALSQRGDYRFQKKRCAPVALEQGENASFSGDPAHLLDGRDVEVH
jgi:hypothetical protein